MSMQRDLQRDLQREHENSEPGELWMALWVGAALVAMVAFSYWLNMA